MFMGFIRAKTNVFLSFMAGFIGGTKETEYNDTFLDKEQKTKT